MYGILKYDSSEQGLKGVKVKILTKISKGDKVIFKHQDDVEEFEIDGDAYLLSGLERMKGATFTYNDMVAPDIAMADDVMLIH